MLIALAAYAAYAVNAAQFLYKLRRARLDHAARPSHTAPHTAPTDFDGEPVS
jgi:3-vinyl bacteriochlorophyllide hydratase